MLLFEKFEMPVPNPGKIQSRTHRFRNRNVLSFISRGFELLSLLASLLF